MNKDLFHSTKCSDNEIKDFRKKVVNFLDDNELKYKRIVALKCYNGCVHIFSGNEIKRRPIRARRRIIKKLSESEVLIERHYEPIIEKEYHSVYRTDNWNEEKKYLIKSLCNSNPQS